MPAQEQCRGSGGASGNKSGTATRRGDLSHLKTLRIRFVSPPVERNLPRSSYVPPTRVPCHYFLRNKVYGLRQARNNPSHAATLRENRGKLFSYRTINSHRPVR